MTFTARMLCALLLPLVFLPCVMAAPPPLVQAEVAYLLQFVEASGCDFYRNGTRYDAARAGTHLRDKYAAIAVTGDVATAEVFIDKVATSSSLSGRPYEVTCPGHERLPVADWLREALARHRAREALR